MTEMTAPKRQYDLVIVGAGPSGLSAARTAARLGFSTLVLERLPEAGQSPHKCNAILTPMPGFIRGRRLLGDLFYPQIDLLIPLSLVVGYPRHHRFISPSGYEVASPFSNGDGSPVAAIDRSGLMKLMVEQAEGSGAEFRFGTEVTGLLMNGSQIAGVRTADEEIRADVVMAAEGGARLLSQSAGLYTKADGHERHALIVTRELEAPHVQRQHLGQITTFGRRFTAARDGFGSVIMPLPGRATVSFTLMSNRPNYHTQASASYYLDEYITRDPRVSALLAGSTVLEESIDRIVINDGPVGVARRGFLSLGDAATPSGHMGVLAAMYLGRKAALIAAEALDMNDISGYRLGMYGRLFHKEVLHILQAERKLMLGLLRMSDAELDHLALVLAGLPLSAPFFSGWQSIPWEAVSWLNERYPEGTYQTDLLQRILDGEAAGSEAITMPAGLWPASMDQRPTVS